MAVVASATGAAVFGLSGVAAGVAGGALLGAGAGALYSGITGDGDILNSALTGGLIGGGVGGLGAALAPALAGGAAAGAAGAGAGTAAGTAGAAGAAAAPTATTLASAANTPALASAALNAGTPASYMAGAGLEAGSFATPAFQIAQGAAPIATGANTAIGAQLANASADPIMAAANMSGMSASDLAASGITPAAGPGLTNMEMLGYGLAGTTALSLLGGMNQKKIPTQPVGQNPAYIRPYTYGISQNPSAYPTGPQYGANGLPILPTSEKTYFNQSYTAGTPYKAAAGGLMAAPPVPGMMQSGPANVDFMGGDMYPTSQQHRAYYATPTQMPTSAQSAMASYEPKVNPLTGQPTANMADGGYTYNAVNQRYNPQTPQIASLTPVGFGLGAVRFPNPGEIDPLGGNPFGFGGAENLQFTPLTNLDAQSRASMLSQWQSQNPNKRTYNPANQTYGYATPDEATLLAMKNAQDQAAWQEQQALQSELPYTPRMSSAESNMMYPGGANGGMMPYNLGGYSDGGRLLKGPGDGVSDDIPAVIGEKQPARLADGEFVVPARIVSELGNGSTDAGAKRLYAMMDRIQSGRKKTVGKDKVAVNTKSEKHLPA